MGMSVLKKFIAASVIAVMTTSAHADWTYEFEIGFLDFGPFSILSTKIDDFQNFEIICDDHGIDMVYQIPRPFSDKYEDKIVDIAQGKQGNVYIYWAVDKIPALQSTARFSKSKTNGIYTARSGRGVDLLNNLSQAKEEITVGIATDKFFVHRKTISTRNLSVSLDEFRDDCSKF